MNFNQINKVSILVVIQINNKLFENKTNSKLVNKVSYPSATNIAGNFLCLIFSPTHLSLVKGSPQERRHALDVVISQIKPRYFSILNENEMHKRTYSYFRRVSFMFIISLIPYLFQETISAGI